ncbi:MAG: ATP-binding protein involved in chromosome partitioning, partial [Psychrobacter glaciei]
MFNFMKKTSTKKPETPEQRAERDSAVDKVLLGYEVGTISIATMVTGLERDGDQLTLNLRLPVNSNPEIIQQELGQLLHPHGIKAIHMNVRLPAPAKGTGSSLPK